MWLVVFLSFLFLSACSNIGFNTVIPEQVEVVKLKALDVDSARKLEEVIEKGVVGLKSFRALADVIAEKSLGRQELMQTIIFERPGSMRMDMFAPGFNQLMGLLIVHNKIVQVLDLQAKTLKLGSAEPGNISEVLGVPFGPEASMVFLCGQVAPSLMVGVVKKAFYQESENTYLMRLFLDYGFRIDVELYVTGLPVRRAKFASVEVIDMKNSNVVSNAKFSDQEQFFIGDSPIFIPKHIELDQLDTSIRISLSYKSLQLNPDTSDLRIFSMDVPKNVERYSMD